ncbi:MAG: substrate-binding domain-containing protein [Candidatus Ratteibacteria bacterium]
MFFPNIVKGMEEVLIENGYDLLLLTSFELEEKLNNYIRIFKEKSIDGLILLNVKKDDKGLIELEKTDYPFICIGRVSENYKGSYVDTDNVKRGYIGTEHLIKQHNLKKIGYLGNELKYLFNIDHFNGYKLALINNDIEIKDEFVKTVPQSIEAGYKGMKKLIENEVEGVILFGNLITMGAIEFLKEKQIKIPDDLKIIITSEFIPVYNERIKFTQIQQDVSALGEMAVKILIEEINTLRKSSKQIVLQPKFINGNSCGCNI